ncbi:MAG: YesL family protein [Cetobacterium sp.]
MESEILEKVYRYTQILWEIIILNFMLIFLSLMGLMFFGWAPGVVAVLTVVKERIIQKKEYKTHLEMMKRTWKIYLKEFKNSNIFGNIILLSIFFLTLNIYNFQNSNQIFFEIIYISSLAIRFLVVMLSFVIFSVYVYYDIGIRECISKSILLVSLNPLLIAILLSWSWLNSKFIDIFPKVSFFVGGYLFLAGVMLINYHFFKKNSKKQMGNGDI